MALLSGVHAINRSRDELAAGSQLKGARNGSHADGPRARMGLAVGWIKHADAKAGIVLSGAATISGIAATRIAEAPTLARVALVITVVASLVAGYHAWTALVPRTLPNQTREESLLFFATLSRLPSAEEVLRRLQGQTEEERLTDYAHQLRELSVIATAKFDHVDRAVNNVAGAAEVLVIALLMASFAST